jgi:Ala-tRNA(Pro) deacylase
MSLATRVRWYLDSHDIEYDIVHHDHSSSSLDSGRKAHVPAGRVAKGVLLEDERGYVLALVPAACRLELGAIEDLLHRRLELASEAELEQIFGDCELGAIPAVGDAYNVPMLVDDSLLRLPDLYFEGGDHEDLVHVGREAFQELVKKASHGHIGSMH